VFLRYDLHLSRQGKERETVPNLFASFVKWLSGQKAAYTCLSGCLGTIALTAILSQKLWVGWQEFPGRIGTHFFIADHWPYLAGLFLTYAMHALALSVFLRFETRHSGWWVLPLMVPIILFAAIPPGMGTSRLYLLAAFALLQLLFFIKWGRWPSHQNHNEP
jgi:hypothetical protein